MNIYDKILLHATLIQGFGPGSLAHVISFLGIDRLPEIYNLTQTELIYECGVQPKQAQLLEAGLKNIKILDQECELLEKHSILWVSNLDQYYPYLLKEIDLPPLGIYVQGQLPHSTVNSIAVVGARKSHDYAQRIINYCIPDLVAQGWAIISGGALGADTMAHEVALQEEGVTVAILGSGLLKPYPHKNKNLFMKIVQAGGALVSSFSLRMEALPGNFPARNRLIAGVSRGCLVIQAGEKSGALITAHCALEQGREVFAVPGPIDDPLSAGCLSLLKQGATLVRSAQDIFDEFGYTYIPSQKIPLQKVEKVQEICGDEDVLLTHCKQPVSIDELFEKTGLSLSEIYTRLSFLQLNGKIEQDFVGLWKKI